MRGRESGVPDTPSFAAFGSSYTQSRSWRVEKDSDDNCSQLR